MKTLVKGTYGKEREYAEVFQLPKIGDEWNEQGYENATVTEIVNVNDEVADSTSFNLAESGIDFYRLSIEYDGDIFTEYICVES